MLRRFLAPLHPDGFKFVLAGVLATLLLFLLWAPAGWLAAIATLWIAYFFRDPWRVTPIRPGLLISPADGRRRVDRRRRCRRPRLAMGDTAVTRIGIFLNIFDVHVDARPGRRQGGGAALHQGPFRQCQPRQGERGQRAAGDPHRPAGRARGRLCAGRRAHRPAHRLRSAAKASRSPPASASASSALARGSMFIARRLMFRWWSRGSGWSAAKPCSPTGSRRSRRARGSRNETN